MNTDIEQQLIAECLSNKQRKTTTLGDKEHRSDIEKYLCQSRYEQEQQNIFNRLPTTLLHSSELMQHNSYQSVESSLGALIVTRDEQGQVRVLRNACRHRGAKLVAGKGCGRRMVCPYHAWSYAMDGQLGSVPGQNHCFPNLNKSENGLLELPSVEKYGFIWLCPAVDSSEDAELHLDQHLGAMGEHLRWLEAAKLQVFKRSPQVWQGNWKLFAEGGLETYHFAFAHKDTIGPYFYNNTAVIDQLGQHFRVVMPKKALESDSARGSIRDCTHTLFFLMPNIVLLVQKQHVDWLVMKPIGVDQTEITVCSLIPSDTDLSDENAVAHWQRNHHITNVTLDEDWVLGESIHRTMADKTLPYIQYGKNEWALQAFNQVINALLQESGESTP